ncbi:hypothetical protein SAMN04489806_2091 [Paramicrobacterium humi]|uniref:Ribonuclease VapC n=1 Tax=Paramicrobacterium humi TaxID=640635 RepID=A0A1H4N5M3_9MICO|nr:type II toxin-antitoxin system VapC family toxin [Microbacterium humi]SEB90581.1 hypothetical protein SAMN04489806_2091 [Microbacterium humi]
MMTVVDTSVLIDVLRSNAQAQDVLSTAFSQGTLYASEVTRVEILAGMRSHEEHRTRLLLGVMTWIPVDKEISEVAGELGRKWLPGNQGIDSPDLIIAATTRVTGGTLLTRNIKHFPMFEGLTAPY